MLDALLINAANVLITSVSVYIVSVVAFRKGIVNRGELMELKKEIIILSGKLEARMTHNKFVEIERSVLQPLINGFHKLLSELPYESL